MAVAEGAPHITADPAVAAGDVHAAATRSPVLANLVVILGFVAIFSTFATDAAASWVLGLVLVLVGGIWAGMAGGQDDGRAG